VIPRRAVATATAFSAAVMACALPTAHSGGVTGADLDEVVVNARRIPLAGAPRAASEGTVLAEQIRHRPLLRTGELLEVVPGLVVTQHTGDGKANQYFLRGFNLDHGTDFSTSVEGMPVNMPSHGHGQGYMDMNFVIPEFVERVVYRKGTYYPELGNFSAAGAAELRYARSLRPFMSLSRGEDGHLRAVSGGSLGALGGELLAGLEYDRNDGPWQLPEDQRKLNGVLRWSGGDEDAGLAVALMGYDGRWTATDQIPQRAIDDGRLDRFGFVDPTNGGSSHRYSLSTTGHLRVGDGTLGFDAWAIDYRLQLFSNFTYAINAEHGDQFEQFDERLVTGGALHYALPVSLGGEDSTWRSGIDLRHDDIAPVGLHLTTARLRRTTVREDDLRQTLAGAWTALDSRWTPWLRSELGLRADRLEARVESSLAANSGSASDTIVSPKASFVIGPWRDTEFFAAAGRGFHSNDARGTTITVDPIDGASPAERVTPLVRATGAELGLRTALLPHTQLSVSLWQLELDSELLFVGDGGVTEPSRPSRRRGVELGIYARPLDGVIVDADLAWSNPRFRDADPAGDRIPGAVERVASLGITVERPSGWFGGLRLRHLGPAALVEDESVRSRPSTLVNVELGRRFAERWSLRAGLYNALDREADDIGYFYESQLPGEAAPVADRHFHPVEPRSLRVTLELRM